MDYYRPSLPILPFYKPNNETEPRASQVEELNPIVENNYYKQILIIGRQESDPKIIRKLKDIQQDKTKYPEFHFVITQYNKILGGTPINRACNTDSITIKLNTAIEGRIERRLNHLLRDLKTQYKITDVKRNKIGIFTEFMNGEKNIKKMPDIVYRMFKDEFGVIVKYDSENSRLLFVKKTKTRLSQSETATKRFIEALQQTEKWAKHKKLVFGYEILSYAGSVNAGSAVSRAAFIDLADFDKNQLPKQLKFFNFKNNDSRTYNLARVFEHEFLGHVYINTYGNGDGGLYNKGKVVDIVNLYRRERRLLERLNYGYYPGKKVPIIFGKTANFKNKRDVKKYVKDNIKKINDNKKVIIPYVESK